MTEKNIFSLYGQLGLGDRERMFRNGIVNNESEILTKRERVLSKTQSCGHIYYKNNIGDREKMFLSGVVNGIPENPTNKKENVVLSKQNGTLNKTQSSDPINLENNIGDREKMFMSGILNNQNGSPITNGHSNREKFGRQNSYTEHGILNYESGEFKKQRTDSGNSNEESVVVNGIEENNKENSTKMTENGNSIKHYHVLNKTQSCGNMFHRNNIGDREKMFLSGILNVIPDNQTNNGNFNRKKLGRQNSYTEHGILNYESGIIKNKSSVSSMSSEGSLDLNGIADNQETNSTQPTENGNSIKQNPVLNKTQSCGNIFYRNHIGDREKMFLSGVLCNKNEIPENPRAERMRPAFARQNSYSEHGILNSGIYKEISSVSSMSSEASLDLNGCLENQKASSISATENKSTMKSNPVLNKTQSCGNFLHSNHIGDREKMFLSGVLINTIEIPENKKMERRNRDFVRQNSYSEHGILNYKSGIFKKRNVSCSNDISTDANVALPKQKNENENSNNPNKILNKTQSCGNIFFRNHIGNREKMFLSAVLNNTIEIPENKKMERRNRDFVRQNSYSEHGILNYKSGIFKKRNVSCSNEISADGNDALQKQRNENENSNNPKKSLNKTQSCGNIFFRNHIGNREKMFLSAVLNNTIEIPENKVMERRNRDFVRQNSYSEHGILNYKSGIFKKRNVSCSNEISADGNDALQKQRNENENSNNPKKSLNKTQSCGNIFFRNHIGNREKMFLSAVLNNTIEIPENKVMERRNRDFVRQNSYSEHGILNYKSGMFKKRNVSCSNEISTDGNIALPKQKNENENSNNPNKSLNKTQSCGNIFFRNHIGDREKMFQSGILNNKNTIPEIQKTEIAKREFARQNSYTEHGILNYKRSMSRDSNENYDAVKEFNGETELSISHMNENSEHTNGQNPAKEMSPATSRIIARVKKSRSFALLSSSVPGYTAGVCSSERRVLVIYTGGTIGMVKNSDRVLEPIKGAFEGLTRTFPQLHDEPYWHKRFLNDDSGKGNLVLPVVKDLDARIVYKIHENETLLDSSNITVEDWITIARDIKLNYELYDGFVVLHGTDTLAYTASALSFMLENIGKPVVVTGSQIPIFEPRSDGADNFVSALIVAGGLNIPEVTVMFDSKLFRGNRTRKISSYNFHAFDSPNCVPLVEFGIEIEVNNKAIFRPTKIEKCQLHEKMSKNVGILRIFPSISATVLHAFFQPPIEGVVLETYGSGNIPSNREDIFKEIELAVKRGVIIVNITQCTSGSVGAPQYETGRRIQACGVISGYDMTPETALAKLSYVLSKDEWDREKKIEMMTSNIRGELTNINSLTLEDSSLIDALASSLKITSPKQLIEVTDRVFTALLLYAIDKEEEVTIQKMQELGAEVNSQNSEGKTPLHEAIYKENVNIVKYLLLRGANVHTKTRCGESPLLTAIQRDQQTIIRLLLNCGAHLASSDNLVVMEMLSLAARTGSVQRLESLKIAAVDFNLTDEMRQTALHKAVLSSRPEVVKYLMDQGVERNVLDILGHSPLDYARRLRSEDMIRLLEDKHNDDVAEEGLWM